MTETTTARRPGARERKDAEREARQLLESKIPLIGDLRVAAADRQVADEDLVAARARARQLVEAARKAGADLVAEANTQIAETERAYGAAFDAAAAGWTAPALVELGYAAPARVPRQRERRGAAAGRNAVARELSGDGEQLPPGGEPWEREEGAAVG